MFYQNITTREVWLGNPNKNLASTYIKKTPLGHRFIYEGRVNGVKELDNNILKSWEVKIVAGLYDLKAA